MKSFDYDIVFLGGLFPKERVSDILNYSIGAVQNAADALQWKFVDGINENNKNGVHILNSYFIGSFPKRYKKMIIDSYEFRGENGIVGINVGFLNLPIFKFFSKYMSLKKYIEDWSTKNNKKKKIMIGYAMTWNVVHELAYAKKLNPDIYTCLIVPDLPQFMNLSKSKNSIYTCLKNVEISMINNDCSFVDRFVILTQHMEKKLKCKNYTVIEGISESNKEISVDKFDKTTFLYTGTLQEKYGIKKLIDQFSEIDNDDIQLIVCGYGEMESYIKKNK